MASLTILAKMFLGNLQFLWLVWTSPFWIRVSPLVILVNYFFMQAIILAKNYLIVFILMIITAIMLILVVNFLLRDGLLEVNEQMKNQESGDFRKENYN